MDGPFKMLPCKREVKFKIGPKTPDITIVRMLRIEQGEYQMGYRIKLARYYVNWLNEQVKLERIILVDGKWVNPDYA